MRSDLGSIETVARELLLEVKRSDANLTLGYLPKVEVERREDALKPVLRVSGSV